jgi:hypothetical protein
MMIFVRLRPALVAMLLVCSPAVGRPQGYVGAIEGVVRDSAGSPIPGVAIALENMIYRGQTDEQGHYRIENVPPGTVSLKARRLGYRMATIDSVAVTAGSVTREDFVLPPGPRSRRAVRIPCPAGQPSPSGGLCVHVRFVGSLDDAPAGVGMVRDRATWNAVVRRFGRRRRSDVPRDSSHIDWAHEMVLLVSYGRGLAELEESWGFNRAETRADTLVITLGPDSLVGKREIFVDGVMFPDALAMPRSTLPVRFEKPVPDGWIPPSVDWGAVADTTPKR